MVSNSVLATILLISVHAIAQPYQRLGDINFGMQSSLGVNLNILNPFASVNQYMVFAAVNDDYGREPWVYDGQQTYNLMDILPGQSGSRVRNFISINNKVIFIANDSLHGNEWWVTNGTPEGTSLMVDLSPGMANGVIGDDWKNFYVLDGFVYFNGTNTTGNRHLWKTDGTPSGTVMVKDLIPGAGSSDPEFFETFQGNLIFRTNIGAFMSDGTEAGTTLITDEFSPTELIGLNDHILMIHGNDLFVSDGTPTGTTHLMEFAAFTSFKNYIGPKFRRLAGFVLFGADDGVHGHELWRSDGTAEGTYMVSDINPGQAGSTPIYTSVYKGAYYFRGTDALHGSELWKSDGTAAGTHLVRDINPDTSSGFTERLFTSPDVDYLFLNAENEFSNRELWASDGTPEGTFEIEINTKGESMPGAFMAYGNKLFFYASENGTGYEPYILDPSLLTATEGISTTVNKFNWHPNPTTGLITHDGVTGRFLIHSSDGSMISSGVTDGNIDLGKIANGVYFITILEGDLQKKKVGTIVVQH